MPQSDLSIQRLTLQLTDILRRLERLENNVKRQLPSAVNLPLIRYYQASGPIAKGDVVGISGEDTVAVATWANRYRVIGVAMNDATPPNQVKVAVYGPVAVKCDSAVYAGSLLVPSDTIAGRAKPIGSPSHTHATTLGQPSDIVNVAHVNHGHPVPAHGPTDAIAVASDAHHHGSTGGPSSTANVAHPNHGHPVPASANTLSVDALGHNHPCAVTAMLDTVADDGHTHPNGGPNDLFTQVAHKDHTHTIGSSTNTPVTVAAGGHVHDTGLPTSTTSVASDAHSHSTGTPSATASVSKSTHTHDTGLPTTSQSVASDTHTHTVTVDLATEYAGAILGKAEDNSTPDANNVHWVTVFVCLA